jgi:hypothetical protein
LTPTLERFIGKLKEGCFHLHQLASLAKAAAIIAEFIRRYDTPWLIERVGYLTAACVRGAAGAETA